MTSKTKKYKSKKEIKKINKSKKKFFFKKKLMKGGNINPPSFQPFGQPNQFYNSLNNYNNDPSDTYNSISSRNLPSMLGGKKRKNIKKNKKNA